MKQNKMDIKVKELQSKGFVIIQKGETQMNRRYYKFTKMQKGTELVIINNQGGTNGISSTMQKHN